MHGVERKGGQARRLGRRAGISRARLTGAQSGDLRVTFSLPDKVRTEVFRDGKHVHTSIVDGSRGWVVTPEVTTEMSAAEVEDVLGSLRADVTVLLRNALEPDAVLAYLGESEVAGRGTYAVRVSLPGSSGMTLHIDEETGDAVAVQYQSASAGPVLVVESDYREVNGLRIAHTSQIVVGSSVTVATLEEALINPELPADAFAPPPR